MKPNCRDFLRARQMLRKNLMKFVGKPVRIKWSRPEWDWPTFILIGFEGDLVWLKGINDPNGCAHDGTTVTAKPSEILRCVSYRPAVGKDGGR